MLLEIRLQDQRRRYNFMDNVPATILCFKGASIEFFDVFLITQNVDSLELRMSRDLIKFGVFVLYIILLSSLIGEI